MAPPESGEESSARDLGSVGPSDEAKSSATDQLADERVKAEIAKLQSETALDEERVKQTRADADSRRKLVPKIQSFVAVWMLAVLILTIASSVQVESWWFRLEPNVLIALLTTTTLNVLGLLVIVLKYLFPS